MQGWLLPALQESVLLQVLSLQVLPLRVPVLRALLLRVPVLRALPLRVPAPQVLSLWVLRVSAFLPGLPLLRSGLLLYSAVPLPLHQKLPERPQ